MNVQSTLQNSSGEPYNIDMAGFKSLLKQVAQLSPEERKELLSVLQSDKSSTLSSPTEGLPDWQADMVARGLAKGTISLYTRTVKRFLDLYPMPTRRDVRNYSVQRLQEVSPSKVRNDQKSLRSFFGFLEVEGLWIDNPTKGLKLLKTDKVIRQAPEKEHVDQLLAAWGDSAQRLEDRVLITLFVDTGLRIREACSLEIKNIDLPNRQLKVMGKGRKERLVPISPITASLIQEYLDKHSWLKEGRYLFATGSKQGYKSIHNLERTFRRLCKRLGIPRVTPHMLRHFFATVSLRNGAKLEVISKILGHSSVAITADVYRTVKQDEIQAEHEKFGPLHREN
jgi:site-specific recombinase XerD